MKKNLLLSLLSVLLCLQLIAQPKRELRGAWIATYANIDWPNRTQTPTAQRAALISILDHHKATGINAVYIQIRSQCDAMYPSSIEPWTADLNGLQGRAPSPIWDPLQFMIDECHKRGMEFHAWINPYRAAANTSSLSSFHTSHIAKQRPEWMLTVGTVMIMNPGLQQVRDHITNVIKDVVTSYDVDGVHFDDYFYPSGTINDNSTFTADPRGFTNIADWRRDNVNLLIARIYDTVKTLKPWVKFGVSPSGIWRNTVANGGAGTAGQEHYSVMYADSRKWLQQGWVDYIAPQVYWNIGFNIANYATLVPWWNNNASGRHIYIGMAGYKVNDPAQGAPWADPNQIPNQVKMNRNNANVFGQIIYNTTSMRVTTRLGFRDSLKNNYYSKLSLIPTMPWRDDTPPFAPSSLVAMKYGNDSVVLNWNKTPDAENELDKAKKYVIYRSENSNVDISNAANIYAITINDTSAFQDKSIQPNKIYYYKVTALDRFANESETTNTASNTAPVVTCPSAQDAFVNENCTVTLPDYRAQTVINAGVNSPAFIVTQSPSAGTVLNGAATVPVSITVTDKAGNTGTCMFDVNVKDTISPTILCNQNINTVTDANKCYATITVNTPAASDNCGVNPVTGVRSDGQPLTSPYAKGVTTITWTATDRSGNSTSCTQTITVEDKQAPIISNASVTPDVLKAPNHKMRDVTVNYTASDNCGSVVTSINVTSNEPVNGTGSGDIAPDWVIVDDHHVQLRAERSGNGNGRIYTIEITGTDADGNVTSKTLQVKVQHDQSDKSNVVLETLPEESNILAVVSPNPSKDKFTLQLKGSSTDAAIVRVIDSKGVRMEAFEKLKGNSTISFGSNYTTGNFFAEVTVGNKKQTIKLIKE
jgi:uncharacterized lipoprotein YddW (UPF0748 family)